MSNAPKKKPRTAPAKSRSAAALHERHLVVRYLRREAKRLTVRMPVPDAIIRDTILAVAAEIADDFHIPGVCTSAPKRKS